jgi:hypothetical protein
MGEIYSKASSVIVWLGETADNSDQALEEICAAAAHEFPKSLNNDINKQAILALLNRLWFKRIWVSAQALNIIGRTC